MGEWAALARAEVLEVVQVEGEAGGQKAQWLSCGDLGHDTHRSRIRCQSHLQRCRLDM